MKRLFLFLFCLAAAAQLQAQKPGTGATTPVAGAPQATPTPTNIAMWRATLPGGTYEVALRSIIAVSSHEYVVDGAARVTEVNIDTAGALVARFYYLEPSTVSTPMGIGAGTIEKAQQLFQEGAERSGQDVWKKVVKSYPTTTHARTVEFRLASKEDLTKLFNSAESAFRLQKNTSYNGGKTEE